MSNLADELRQVVGGKAATLRALQGAGFPVPEFLVSPPNVEQAVMELGLPLAVRSSASIEDSPTTSFAGQFSSYLNLCSIEDVDSAVEKCRDSLQSAAVARYCGKHGIDPRSLRMDVILQRMLRPELAGVAFTVNPITGAEEVLVEACIGLADRLLAGRSSALPHDHPLMQRYLPIIKSVARRIQRFFGAPQDIEFAVQDGTVFVLQSRPITSITFAPDVGEWTNADFRDGGVSSQVCTPLMWSLYQFIWDHSLKASLREIRLWDGDFDAGRMFFGRPYWNLGAVKRCLAKVPGYVERHFDSDLSVRVNYEGNGVRTPLTFFTALRAIPTFVSVSSYLREQLKAAQQFLADGIEPIRRKYDPLPRDINRAFRELVERDYFSVETTYFRTIFAASLAKMDFLSSFPNADYACLMAALPALRHMAPMREIHAMASRGKPDVASLVRRFRHHSRRGLDVRFPRWDEDQAFIAKLLENLPRSLAADPRPAYERARSLAISQLPSWKHSRFLRKLNRLRTLVWLREEMRDLSSQTYYLIRQFALEIARRRCLGDDIFFMTFPEIFADDRSNVERNREVFDSFRNFTPPNEIGIRFPFDSDVASGDLCGVGASPGTVQGTARIARSVEQSMGVEPGAILVCPYTEPGWIPVLDRVAGVVTETGGLLSHAAVICREYGIPAVLGVPGATRRIPDGSTLRIHGDRGHVEILE